MLRFSVLFILLIISCTNDYIKTKEVVDIEIFVHVQGIPIKNAHVNVYPSNKTGITDENGRTVISGVFLGPSNIEVSSEGLGQNIKSVFIPNMFTDLIEIELKGEKLTKPTIRIRDTAITKFTDSNQKNYLKLRIIDSKDAPTEVTLNLESSIDGIIPFERKDSNNITTIYFNDLSEDFHTLIITATDSDQLYSQDSTFANFSMYPWTIKLYPIEKKFTGLQVTWDRYFDQDFKHYILLRGTSSDSLSKISRIKTNVNDTTYLDDSFGFSETLYFYQIKVVNIFDNESLSNIVSGRFN